MACGESHIWTSGGTHPVSAGTLCDCGCRRWADDHKADVNDAEVHVRGGMIGRLEPVSIFADTFEAYRQQGRDEILREIVKAGEPLAESQGYVHCVWCLGPDNPTSHKPDCLWLRASKVGK